MVAVVGGWWGDEAGVDVAVSARAGTDAPTPGVSMRRDAAANDAGILGGA